MIQSNMEAKEGTQHGWMTLSPSNFLLLKGARPLSRAGKNKKKIFSHHYFFLFLARLERNYFIRFLRLSK